MGYSITGAELKERIKVSLVGKDDRNAWDSMRQRAAYTISASISIYEFKLLKKIDCIHEHMNCVMQQICTIASRVSVCV